MAKHSSHILDLARKGAEHRFEELKAEIAALVKHFPHLSDLGRVSHHIDISAEPAATIDRKPRRRSKFLTTRRVLGRPESVWFKAETTSRAGT
jgi:hypothetical protein